MPGSTRSEIRLREAHYETECPTWQFPSWENRGADLNDKTRRDDVSGGNAIDLSPLHFLKEAAHNGVRFLTDAQSPKTRVRLPTADRIRTYHQRWVNDLQSRSVVSLVAAE